MTIAREHTVVNGKRWGTLSECFSRDSDGPCIVIPISEIEGMSDAEMASAVRGLVDEAKITGVFEWLDKFEYQFGFLTRDNENPKKFFINCCMALGRQDEFTQSRISDLQETLRIMEMLQHQNAEVQDAFFEVCELLDGAYNFLMNKGKLTPGQQRARSVILKLRNGCALCGLLDGQHIDRCLTLRKSAAGEVRASTVV